MRAVSLSAQIRINRAALTCDGAKAHTTLPAHISIRSSILSTSSEPAIRPSVDVCSCISQSPSAALFVPTRAAIRPQLLFCVLVMLTRTRSKPLAASTAADSTSEDELLSSQSQSASDGLLSSSIESSLLVGPDDSEEAAAGFSLLDAVSQRANAATVHIRCPTAVPSAADAIDLTAAESSTDAAAAAAVGWSDVSAPSVLHVLPCEIAYNGPAAVQRYFQPVPARSPASSTPPSAPSSSATYISTAEPSASSSRWYSAAFRGRQLTGERVALPQHTIGLLIRDAKQRTASSSSSSSSDGGTSKRRRAAARPPTKAASQLAAHSNSDAFIDVEAAGTSSDSEHANGSTALAVDGGESEAARESESESESEARVDWLVDGWFDSLTLWGRDSDWKGADQCVLKRSLLDWPVIAASLHNSDVPLSSAQYTPT